MKPVVKSDKIDRSSMVPNVATASTIGTCCASGIYRLGCLKCAGCVVGSAGCAIGTQACYNCTKQKIKSYSEDLNKKNPNYDPPGVSESINKGELPTTRITITNILDYIKPRIHNENMKDNDIISRFGLNPNYNEPFHIFSKFDKPEIDANINKYNKKVVGGMSNRVQRKRKSNITQSRTRVRTTMRKNKSKGKRKINTIRKSN